MGRAADDFTTARTCEAIAWPAATVSEETRLSGDRTFNVGNIVDNQPISKFTYLVWGLCCAATISDGYNLTAIGLVAPGAIKEFGVHRADFAPLFSIGVFGMLVGALIAGFLGDRFGRKQGIVIATTIICIASFGCGFAQNLDQLFWLRFATGVGLGGLLPNVTSLITEFVPKKGRGIFTTYAFMGITTGGVIPGLVSASLGVHEWRAVFYVGGALTLLVLPAVIFLLPESLKFLALRPKRERELRASLARLLPDVVVPEDATLVLNEAKKSTSIAQLFTGKLLVLTPTLWLTFMSIMLVNFFMNSWLVVLLTDVGFSPANAATALSLYQVGGIFGGLLMGIALDRVGPIVLGFCSLIGCISIALIGVSGISPVTYVLVGLVGFGVLGTQVGLSAAAGLLYPTSVRSKGAGFAHSIGRIGAISGPLIAGALIANNSSLVVVFLTPSVPFAVAALCGFILTWVWTGTTFGHGFATMEQKEATEGAEHDVIDTSNLTPAKT